VAIDHDTTVSEHRHLRFCFEAARLRQALALAAELRTYAPDDVHVRPAPWRFLRGPVWTVAATTPPALLAPAVLELWEEAMEEVVRRCPDCRLVGWKPVRSLDDPR
jgi:hypothetical protein